MSLDLLGHQSLRELVAQRIRRSIMEGEIELGTRLVETTIADELGVSRGPVREAFLDLAREGLLEITPRRGACVTTLSADDIWQIYTLRAHAEILLIRYALPLMTAADLDDLTALCEEMGSVAEGRASIAKVAELDMAFHSRLAAVCPYERMVEAYHVLDGQIGTGIYTVVKLLSSAPIIQMKDRHLQVVNELRTGSMAEVERVLWLHWMETADRIRNARS